MDKNKIFDDKWYISSLDKEFIKKEKETIKKNINKKQKENKDKYLKKMYINDYLIPNIILKME